MDSLNLPESYRAMFSKDFFDGIVFQPISAEPIAEATTDPAIVMTFEKFAKGNFEAGHRNLYIVWRGKQALYVGISRDNIWSRWFAGARSHICINAGGHWIKGYSSPIGQAIIRNRPTSMRWKIELRHIAYPNDLHDAERQLIHDLHPLFNSTYLPPLTDKEIKIYRYLTREDDFYTALRIISST
jgi:hypothetical protein